MYDFVTAYAYRNLYTTSLNPSKNVYPEITNNAISIHKYLYYWERLIHCIITKYGSKKQHSKTFFSY